MSRSSDVVRQVALRETENDNALHGLSHRWVFVVFRNQHRQSRVYLVNLSYFVFHNVSSSSQILSDGEIWSAALNTWASFTIFIILRTFYCIKETAFFIFIIAKNDLFILTISFEVASNARKRTGVFVILLWPTIMEKSLKASLLCVMLHTIVDFINWHCLWQSMSLRQAFGLSLVWFDWDCCHMHWLINSCRALRYGSGSSFSGQPRRHRRYCKLQIILCSLLSKAIFDTLFGKCRRTSTSWSLLHHRGFEVSQRNRCFPIISEHPRISEGLNSLSVLR